MASGRVPNTQRIFGPAIAARDCSRMRRTDPCGCGVRPDPTSSARPPPRCPTLADVLSPEFRDLFPDAEPIFVVGAARSGTTIVGNGLRFGAGIPGNREGFVYTTAYLMLATLDERWQQIGPGIQHMADEDRSDPRRERASSRFDFDALRRDVLRHFHAIAPPNGERVWVDRTPDIYMVHATPILASAYPRGRWIWVQRNGIEVLDSRRRTHPEMTFEAGCRDWAMVIRDWQRARKLVAERCLEIDQRDVAADGPATAARIAAFLGLGEDAAAGIAEVFGRDRPGRTTTRDYRSALRLEDTDWSEDERAMFRTICADAMAAAGYAL